MSPGCTRVLPMVMGLFLIASGCTKPEYVAGDTLDYRKSWLPPVVPRAVVLAVHGFNDHAGFFEDPGRVFAATGVAVFAYDQYGFGDRAYRGRWVGVDLLRRDLRQRMHELRINYSGVPLFLLGHSMGADVIVTALGSNIATIDGVILVAPAVRTLKRHQRFFIRLADRLLPDFSVKSSIHNAVLSDNQAHLAQRRQDQRLIKKTRLSAVLGMLELMHQARIGAAEFRVPTLIVHGNKDAVAKTPHVQEFYHALPFAGTPRQQMKTYVDGYHLLLNDVQAPDVWADILSWINQIVDSSGR